MDAQTPRYFLAVALPQPVVDHIAQWYTQATGEQFHVRFPHITIVPPFYLLEHTTTQTILGNLHFSVPSFQATATHVGVFTQHQRSILHLTMQPAEQFTQLNKQALQAVESLIRFDTTPYSSGKLPPFEAHSTIDYDAPTEAVHRATTSAFEPISFVVDTISLRKETDQQGVWEEVGKKELHTL